MAVQSDSAKKREVTDSRKIFVYGALMRGGEEMRAMGSAIAEGYAVRFVARGAPLLEPAFAALIAEPEGRAHGVVFEIEPKLWHSIARHEVGYDLKTITVQLGGTPLTVETLLLQEEERLSIEGKPSARYMGLLLEGALSQSLPQHYVAHLQRLKTAGSRLSTKLKFLEAFVMILVPYIGLRGAIVVTVLALVAAAYGLLLAAGQVIDWLT